MIADFHDVDMIALVKEKRAGFCVPAAKWRVLTLSDTLKAWFCLGCRLAALGATPVLCRRLFTKLSLGTAP